jgi:hypothetical protein
VCHPLKVNDQPHESTETLIAAFAMAGEELAGSILASVPWFVRTAASRVGVALDSETLDRVIESMSTELDEPLRSLLAAPIDEQRGTPLALVRAAASQVTAVFQALGVPPLDRDPFDVRALPTDLYGIAPATWRDVGPDVEEPGMRWGVIKAFLHRRLHAPVPGVAEEAPRS